MWSYSRVSSYNQCPYQWYLEYVEHREYGEDDSLVEFTKNEDGTIDFLVQFYNGGCCLQEVLEDYKNFI